MPNGEAARGDAKALALTGAADELTEHRDAELDEGLESQSFRESLLAMLEGRGTPEDIQIVKSVDNRFTAHVRRIRKGERQTRVMMRALSDLGVTVVAQTAAQTRIESRVQAVEPVVDDVKQIKRLLYAIAGALLLIAPFVADAVKLWKVFGS